MENATETDTVIGSIITLLSSTLFRSDPSLLRNVYVQEKMMGNKFVPLISLLCLK